MDVCKCSKIKEISKMETEIVSLFKLVEVNRKELNDMNKVYDLIYGITTNVSVLAEQMTKNTEELSKVSKDVDTIKRVPSDYNYYKRQAGKIEHYKRVAIGAIIISVVGAFMAGKMF